MKLPATPWAGAARWVGFVFPDRGRISADEGPVFSLMTPRDYCRVSSLPTKMLLSEPQNPRFFLAGWFACNGCGCGTTGVCPSARRMSAANSGAATRPENSHSGSTRATRTSNAVSAAGSAGRNGDGTTDTTSGCTINVYETVTSGGADGAA